MEYQVTARKWRPQRFEDVVGQEHITATLKNAIKSNRIAHAYIFTGPRGVGKTTTARILAKALNCENSKDSEPCNECEMCKAINESQTLDIIEIDGASNRGIDEIRTLRESVKYAPTRGKFKVYIIDEVHMLTKESFNAFLKTLEEPPAHTIFIFATTDIHKVPLTIISRCQRFDFRRIQLDTIKKTLSNIAKQEKISIDDKTLTLISKKADGALRDAQSLFDQVVSFCGEKIDAETVSKMLNLIDEDLFFNISDAVLNKNFNIVFETTDRIYQNGWDFIDFTDGLIEHFRNILTVIITEKTELIETADIFRKRYINYIQTFSKGDLLRILNYLNKLQQELRYSNNQKLKIEIALTNLVGLEKSATLSEILSQIENQNISQKKSDFIESKPQRQELRSKSPIQSQTKSNDTPSEPEIKSEPFIPPTLESQTIGQSELNLGSLTDKWQEFVNIVCNEKSLLLSPFFSKIKPINFDGVNLHLESSDESAESSLLLHIDYLTKKSKEIFGKKINFKFGSEAAKDNKSDEKLSEKQKKQVKSQKSTDPYEKIILEELNGKQIQ
ncbi:MAG: DNA polymerase III subunit gamma/tau [Ignavibacteriales bacterium UTCHB2]|mgnify:FL=1|jgi:DNA polymerase-3 subunit gamma/tau|nr:MAG: DNA polymerase III subunit tau [Ignavibacteria bacterium ADurb.Bin266]OQY70854.1 MAG: DNA polymerase III subunit gamma/tau [Ignavibacteriales bacterium UTCHB2]HQI41001.1 DNA polymerase III subunit gamma/tau [Ignavibacteriaceae bacterium]